MKIFLNNVGHKTNVPPMSHFQEDIGRNTLLKKKINEEEEVRSKKKGIIMEERQGNSQDKLKGSSMTIVVYQA